MLKIIKNDHINISRLLKLLTKHISSLEMDQQIDYRVTKSIINYLRTYSDKYHHPLEDFIYDYYSAHHEQSKEDNLRLHEEHKHLKKVTVELDELLNMVLLDAIVPKNECIEKLQNFVDLQVNHMNYEDQRLLPAIEKSFTPDDWLNIEQQWKHNAHHDPLFGSDIADQYKKLAAAIEQE
ncbi:hemerythrin domain-containing protein [Psychromonas sp. PT13]|uniref:hemerythrin domain-containing protein n=1 Tax=Psychromonas sp. PT13 TaxID=3439547 RepID=UPI003EB9FC21